MRRRFDVSPEMESLYGLTGNGRPIEPIRPRQAARGAKRPRRRPPFVAETAKPVRARQAPRAAAAAVRGRATLHPHGFCFLQAEDGEAYYLRAFRARALLTGDIVEFIPAVESSEGKEAGKLIRVVRAASQLLCEVKTASACDAALAGFIELAPDEPCFFPVTLPIGCPVAAGEVVAVQIPAYDGPASAEAVQASMLFNLGRRNRDGFDLDYARARHGFHERMPATLGFPADVVEDAPLAAQTDIPFVTIDGESTRDLDDAVYARALTPEEGEGWEVRVAIADVSWYVRPGSDLDAWAAQRCTSLYLPGCVTPMLPESLSTDRCSLVAGADRRAVVMTLVVGVDGEVLARRVERALIRSAARLSYVQVAGFMAGQNASFAEPVAASLHAMTDLYRVLAAAHDEAGRLDFEEPEPTLAPEGEGGGFHIRWESRNDAHKLVEELMLLANRTAATMLVDRYGAGLFRHQPPPDAESWKLLRDWASTADQALPETPSMQALAALAAAFAGDAQVAAQMRIRSAMQPAKYVVAGEDVPSGHFSLSAVWYTHFTSPIRRYADLLVHRLLLAPEGAEPDEAGWRVLEAQVQHCSERAHSARMAERMVWDRLKLASFMKETAAGAAVRARIVRATRRGLRVVVIGSQCSAWLPAEDLKAKGCAFSDAGWTSAEEGLSLREGAAVSVAWSKLSLERPAYPELQVGLVPTQGAVAPAGAEAA
jgi:ribonuclease R